ncbi:MAG: WG repeat-containing protein [Prevotellaceae bacterium]|jgi:formylglycine-generating enzyme required for sulfatase activity|nr:WG repeat-containing protein [Prevotellaceae bacterium]
MKTRLFVLTVFIVAGSYCKAQDLEYKKCSNGKYSFIDTTGREVVPCKYDYVWHFNEGLAAVKLNGKYGYIDRTGKEVIPLKYDYAYSFDEGLAKVKLNGKWGYIDRTEKAVIPLKYDAVRYFEERLAPVKLNGKWGYIDRTGNEVIPLKYDDAKYFNRGLATVQLNGKEMHIDKQGNEYTTEEEALKAVFVEPEMVFVEGGTFLMGCTGEQQDSSRGYDEDEKPVHEVTSGSFYIGKYEVTQMQWKTLMGSNPSYGEGDSLPVENVSWDDVQKFIERINTVTGRNYRLPTEAEWEYAARGGNQSKGYKYSGSNYASDVACFNVIQPVGTKQPNELGLYDMSGNVSEWCYDWFDTYPDSTQNNPSVASCDYDTCDIISLSDTACVTVCMFTVRDRGDRHVIRGGSFYYSAYYCRVADRGNGPSYTLH